MSHSPPSISNSFSSLSISTSLKQDQGIPITGNVKQPCQFFLNLDKSGEKLKIQVKNKDTKDGYYGEYTNENLNKIGFHQSLKGFYNRLHMAIQSTNPDELRAYYWFYSTSQHSIDNPPKHANLPSCNTKYGDALALCLEEKSKYDDDWIKWIVALQILKIKDTVKLTEKLEDVVEVVNTKYTTTKQQLEHIVQQVKQKFNSEKEERIKLQTKIELLENIATKLSKRILEYKGEVDETNVTKKEEITLAKTEITEQDKKINAKIELLINKINNFEKKLNYELLGINKTYDEICPKLARLKTRKDFTTEQAYIEYINKCLDSWNSKIYGPILVRINQETCNPKLKVFINYIGIPKKWNDSIVKVEWFGSGKKEESVKWNELDVYLPLSAYYYPDCPSAKMPNYDINQSSDK